MASKGRSSQFNRQLAGGCFYAGVWGRRFLPLGGVERSRANDRRPGAELARPTQISRQSAISNPVNGITHKPMAALMGYKSSKIFFAQSQSSAPFLLPLLHGLIAIFTIPH